MIPKLGQCDCACQALDLTTRLATRLATRRSTFQLATRLGTRLQRRACLLDFHDHTSGTTWLPQLGLSWLWENSRASLRRLGLLWDNSDFFETTPELCWHDSDYSETQTTYGVQRKYYRVGRHLNYKLFKTKPFRAPRAQWCISEEVWPKINF